MDSKIYVSAIKITEPIPKDNYLSGLPVVDNLIKMKELTFSKPITFFVGENGIGKSTLIEAIAVKFGFNPEGGTRNYNFRTKNTHSKLHEYIGLVKTCNFAKSGYFLRAESFYNAISYVEYLDREFATDTGYLEHLQQKGEGTSCLHQMSHGESFLRTINDFRANGLYILDEPEAALSPNGIMKIMCRINALVEKGCQFIISTHSPILTTLPNADIYQLSNDAIERVEYTQTEHFLITKKFLNAPEQMVKYLLD